MKKYNIKSIYSFLLLIAFIVPTITKAQNGDQILDGIGETGMVSRYIFKDDLKDWSRNNLHGIFLNGTPKFVDDPKFTKVLSFSSSSKGVLTLPTDILSNIESLSLSTWINLKSNNNSQVLFDFGKQRKSLLKVTIANGKLNVLFGQTIIHTTSSFPMNKWSHLIVVLDAAAKQISVFVDNQIVGEKKETIIDFDKLFGKEVMDATINVGVSLGNKNLKIDALLHDFRIYRVPLSKRQIAGIYNNVVKGVRQDPSKMGKSEDNLPEFPITQAQFYNSYLLNVDEVTVETNIGELPRLPSFINGTYKDAIVGPKVRVLWPSPIDNVEVLKAGQYKIKGKIPGSNIIPTAIITVKAKQKSTTPKAVLQAFALEQIELNTNANNQETKFIENANKFLNTLATTDPNSFLYMFRNAFGQPQPTGAKPLGVWDSQDTKLRGHATGHYLTALAQAYASTSADKNKQAVFAEKMNVMVDVLYDLSKLSGSANEKGKSVGDPLFVPKGENKETYDSDLSIEGIRNDYWNWGKGYISAYPPDQFIMLEHGAKYGGQKNQVWAPYYTLHKILAGLLDVYQVSGNKKALDVAVGMTDWVHARLNNLPKETLISMWNTYIAGEFGGMNETLARLSDLTNDKKYLHTAQLFDNIDMFFGNANREHGLAKNVDSFRGLHANQHIPQIVGSIEMYRVSNMEEYYKVADNFWYKAVNDYMYSIGGVAGARTPANAECFTKEPSTLYENGFSAGGQNETCATYNMLKLSANLFLFDQNAAYMDYYERALYNHILASVDEKTAANTYHVPIRPGSVKQFGNPNMTGFTCCNGTAIESNTKLQSAIYHKTTANDALYINLYIPSTLHWKEKDIRVQQITNFPYADNTKIVVDGSGQFKVNLRVPEWAKKGFIVSINGEKQTINAVPSSYVALNRTWKKGDTIEVQMPLDFHLDPVMDQQNIASLFYGPILLTAQEQEARVDWRKVTLDVKNLGQSIKGNPSKLEFTIDGVLYKPFYDTYGRHSVYLDVTLQ